MRPGEPSAAIAAPGSGGVLTVLSTVAGLSFLQSLLGQFGTQGVTLFLRDGGASASLIGLVFLGGIPFVLRFLWAPVLDRYRLGADGRASRIGQYGRWVILGQVLAAIVLAVWLLLDPAETPALVVATVPVLLVAVAAQLVATGAFMIAALERGTYPRGAVVQGAAAAVGAVALGAGVLYLLGELGWTAVVSALLCLTLVCLLASPFALRRSPAYPTGHRRPSLLSQFSIFRDRRVRLILLATTASSAVAVPGIALKSVLLIDAGLSVSNASLVGLVFANVAVFALTLAVRPLMERYGCALVLLGLTVAAIAVMSICGLVLITGGAITLWTAVPVAIFGTATGYTMISATRPLVMVRCLPERRAADLASFGGVESVALLLFVTLASQFYDWIGPGPMFCAGAVISTAGVATAFHLHRLERADLSRRR
ncbi:hypothetical protein [Amorphus orientalis]|uniref:MFS family permease n=1 Tax=Amorphus orientalis TaxID=649198 RepID=A0AAE4AUT5_9HYPH|nr:hypothetical protein [Amorphus orientalis]MDQ0317502.1 MFS family permease [Amorphus orientalis]